MANANNGLQVALYPAAFTLLGALITAGIGWASAAQTAAINYRQSCVTRIDAKESLIRQKAEAFLSAQGGLVSLAAHKTHPFADVERLVDETTRAGYVLSSYLDGKLAATTQLLVLNIGTRLDSKNETSTQKDDEYHLQLKSSWSEQYRSFLKALEDERKGC
ncbi:hypothetical protein F6R97_04200 [Pseudomonas sp. JV414]|uniref:hypothetical protein n=1 Tax=Pseudomonas sp. JV414 TaxID=1733110 RepID=UPI0028E0CB2F|nr:hypothetical protein [Pseudomonas sp. JV414]MDT9673856.1 hypothetical protein [Pseudomonas sp. JV414]